MIQEDSTSDIQDFATAWQHLLAWVLDLLVFLIVGFGVGAIGVEVLFLNGGFSADDLGILVEPASLAIIFLIGIIPWGAWVSFVFWRLMTKSQTPGKQLVGISIVNAEGEIPWFGQILLRELLAMVAVWLVLSLAFTLMESAIGTVWDAFDNSVIAQVLYIVPLGCLFVWIAADPQGQTLHDRIARTYVVKTRKR